MSVITQRDLSNNQQSFDQLDYMQKARALRGDYFQRCKRKAISALNTQIQVDVLAKSPVANP